MTFICNLFNPNCSGGIGYFSVAIIKHQDQKQLVEKFILVYSYRKITVSHAREAWQQGVGMEAEKEAESSLISSIPSSRQREKINKN